MGRHKKVYVAHEFTGNITETGKLMRDEKMNTRLNARLFNEGRRKAVIISMDKCIVSVIEVFEDGTQKNIYERQHQWHTCTWIYCRWIKTYISKGYEERTNDKKIDAPEKKKRGRPAKTEALNTSDDIVVDKSKVGE